jgi:hypothetical protein
MATTTTVIYPAVGFCGSTNCVRVFDKSVEEVRALGRTARERFDLAIEVKSWGLRGVASPEVRCADVPAAYLAPWS